MKASEIRNLPVPEMEKRLRDLRDRQLQARLRQQTGQVEKSHEFALMRRDIARLETILRQKRAATAPAAA